MANCGNNEMFSVSDEERISPAEDAGISATTMKVKNESPQLEAGGFG
jgi:hypothetical protein